MIEKTLLAFWGVWLLLILVAAFRVMGFSVARRHQDRRWKKIAGPQKPVALIVPVKGFDLQSTPRFFDSIFSQNYGDYRVIVCFESWTDPVASWLCEHLELGPRRPVWTHPDSNSGLRSITLVCGGLAQDEGQKVHNQRAAFADLTSRDAIVAFADADILCGEDWLSRLVAPINCGTHELATTYRWLVPKRPTLPSQIASVINASITTQGGASWCTFLWGGSMALARPVFDELDVPKLLAGSLNDDLRLSKAARATGRKIAFVRSLILPTPVDFTWKTFFEFARRQYTQVKFFSPILYTGINLVLGFYTLGALSIIAALVYGYFFAWIPVAAAYVIDQFRSLVRQQIYLSLFRDNGIRQKLFAAAWLEHMLTPFWMLLHWLILASTWTQNRITWAGVRYRIDSKSKTRILQRAEEMTPLPAGAPGLAMLTALHDRRRGAVAPTIRTTSAPTEPVSATVTLPSSAPEVQLVEASVGMALGTEPEQKPQEAVAPQETMTEVSAGVTGNGPTERSLPLPTIPTRSARLSPPRVFPNLRNESKPGRSCARDSRPATERALAKTRLKTAFSSPLAPAMTPRTSGKASEASLAKASSWKSLPSRPNARPSFRPRTTAEQRLAGKSRATAGIPGIAGSSTSEKARPPRLSTLPRAARVPRQGQIKPPSFPGSSKLRPLSSETTSAVSSLEKPVKRTLSRSASPSLASRRALPGGRLSALLPGRCAPAPSLHAVSGSCVGLRPCARPVSRGPSSRP